MFIDTANAENKDNATIKEKLNVVSEYIENTRNGSKNKNSEIVINGKKSRKNIPIKIKT
ncbi:MAG: hypothetical protein VX995_02085 [Thermoproteota archaeon]|nr:hypothetical protein [Thermoproteota archaeon]